MGSGGYMKWHAILQKRQHNDSVMKQNDIYIQALLYGGIVMVHLIHFCKFHMVLTDLDSISGFSQFGVVKS